MGWVKGEGLGVQGQGRLEPIETKVPKGRQGLGHDTFSHFRVLAEDETPEGPHAWTKEKEELSPPSAEDDRVYKWSRWSASEDPNELHILALEGLKKAAIQPLTSEEARGPPITDMTTQSRYCSDELLLEMLFYKVN